MWLNMSREKSGKTHQLDQMIDGGGCSKPLCQASTLIELTFMEAMEKVMDTKFAKLEDRLNDIDEKSDKMFRIITNEEYGKNTHIPHGKMDQRLTTLEETLDSVSESVIDKLIPAVIKMQKDVKTIRKDIDTITKQQEDENMRLNQNIHKMQDRLDETFLRASDTKQMGREIIKNTEDLLREANKVENAIDVLHGSSKIQESFTRSEGRCASPPRSPVENTLRPRSPPNERESRPENEHYDPEEILSRSIQKEKNLEHSSKGNPSDPRIHESPERYRSRSSFSDRIVPNGDRFSKEQDRRNSLERNNKTPQNRREESPIRNMPDRQKRPRTPPEDPRERPPSPEANMRQPGSPDRNTGRRTPPPQRRLSSNERAGRPRREFSPLVTRYPSPSIDRSVRPPRPRTPLSPGKIYTDNQEATEENGVFIDKFGEEKHWTRWTYTEPNIKRAKIEDSPPKEDEKLEAARKITVTVARTPSPKRSRKASSSSEEGIIH